MGTKKIILFFMVLVCGSIIHAQTTSELNRIIGSLPSKITSQPTTQSFAATGNAVWGVQGGGFYYLTVTNAPAATTTFNATVTFETSPNNSTWSSVNANPVIGLPGSGLAAASTTTAPGLWQVQIPATALYFRARVSSYTSGTIWTYFEGSGVLNQVIMMPFTPSVTSGNNLSGWINTAGLSEIAIQVSAITTCVVTAQGTDDPAASTVQSINMLSDNNANQASAQTFSTTGTYSIINPDHKWVRFQVTSTGSVLTIQGIAARFGQSTRLSNAQSAVGIAGTPNIGTITTLSQFLAAAAAADGKANPTTTMVLAGGYNYNSSTWDRNYNNYNTTTGDAGAKVASFNGATQTNFNARGATITVLCGTVSGTTPTLTAQLQWSPDAGTTWINISSASGTVTATGNTIVFQVYPTNFSTAGASPGALTTGATQTVQLNTTLPRTWRLAYTITGTTPSFTLTGVYVNYQL